jgi:predicted esterase
MGAPVAQGLDEARKAVLAMVEQVQRDTGLPLSRFILAGFSQGAMLATDVALHLPESPAALCIFSVREPFFFRRPSTYDTTHDTNVVLQCRAC